MDMEEETFTLKTDSELRFEIKEKGAKVYVQLKSGFAEMFGTELIKKKFYEFKTGAKVAIFTYQGCLIGVRGKTDVRYTSKKTPMVQYLNCHAALEQLRNKAEEKDTRGPIAMVVGPKDVGKNTLCRILLNYAVRLGRRPLYADIDVGQSAISIPGTIATILIERPANIEDGFSQSAPLTFHFGHKSPNENKTLYTTIISKMAKVNLESLLNKRTKYSGMVINTCGWVEGEGYRYLLHTTQAFEVGTIFVLGQKRLYNQLLRDIPSVVKVVLLPKSGGVVKRSKALRNKARDIRVKEYFYGFRTPLYPFSFEVKWSDIKIFKIGAPLHPDSCITIGKKAKDNHTKLFAVQPGPSLTHHLLSVSLAESPEDDLISTNIDGYVCVTDVDSERQTLTILSPQPHPLPYSILLLSEIRFMGSH